MNAKAKANHLAETFQARFTMADQVLNDYTDVEVPYYRRQEAIADVTEQQAEQILVDLRSDSATGPDELLTRILKECAKQLARPFCMLAKCILL